MATGLVEGSRAAAASRTAIDSGTDGLQEFLAFRLGGEEYGIDILRVQEIRSYEPPTRIANSHAFIKGVINLRGVIVPIVDLRLKFGMDDVRYDAFTVVIVLNIGQRVIGIVVDSVSDVISLSPDQLRPVPDLSLAVDSQHLRAIASVQERMLILLDIEKLLGGGELGMVCAGTEAQSV